jgi:hypothetical protein
VNDARRYRSGVDWSGPNCRYSDLPILRYNPAWFNGPLYRPMARSDTLRSYRPHLVLPSTNRNPDSETGSISQD